MATKLELIERVAELEAQHAASDGQAQPGAATPRGEVIVKKVEDGATVELFDFKGGQTWRVSKNGKTIVREFKSSGDVPDLIQELNS